MSKFSIINWAICSQPDRLEVERDQYKQMLSIGKYRRPANLAVFSDCRGIHPYDIEPFMQSCGYKYVDLAGLECLVFNQYAALCKSPKEIYDEWLDLLYSLCRDKSLWGSSGHLLYVGKKSNLKS